MEQKVVESSRFDGAAKGRDSCFHIRGQSLHRRVPLRVMPVAERIGREKAQKAQGPSRMGKASRRNRSDRDEEEPLKKL